MSENASEMPNECVERSINGELRRIYLGEDLLPDADTVMVEVESEEKLTIYTKEKTDD